MGKKGAATAQEKAKEPAPELDMGVEGAVGSDREVMATITVRFFRNARAEADFIPGARSVGWKDFSKAKIAMTRCFMRYMSNLRKEGRKG